MRYDKEAMRLLRMKMEEAMHGMEEELGIKITVGRCRYGATNATFTVDVADVAKDGTVMGKEQEALQQYGEMFGLPKGALGKRFSYKGRTWIVDGLTKGGKVLVKRDDEVPYTFKVDAVVEADLVHPLGHHCAGEAAEKELVNG